MPELTYVVQKKIFFFKILPALGRQYHAKYIMQ